MIRKILAIRLPIAVPDLSKNCLSIAACILFGRRVTQLERKSITEAFPKIEATDKLLISYYREHSYNPPHYFPEDIIQGLYKEKNRLHSRPSYLKGLSLNALTLSIYHKKHLQLSSCFTYTPRLRVPLMYSQRL